MTAHIAKFKHESRRRRRQIGVTAAPSARRGQHRGGALRRRRGITANDRDVLSGGGAPAEDTRKRNLFEVQTSMVSESLSENIRRDYRVFGA
jgi:hypothetical protein